jgi:hypothetical protein
LGIDCTALNVSDPQGIPSNLIIKETDILRLAAYFTLSGSAANYVASNSEAYTVDYYYEGFGAAPEGTFGTASGTTVSGVLGYGDPETRVQATPKSAGMTPGTYMLAAVVTIPGPQMTAFNDSRVVIRVIS